VQQGAELIAVGMFPNVWKFFWAPVADTTLTRKRWYLLACGLCAAGMLAMAVVPLGPSTLRLVDVAILMTAVAATFLGFSVEAMVAHLTPPAERGRVSGWFQAGNLGGTGIGGGAGLWLLMNLPAAWQAGLVLAGLTLACAAVLPLLPDVPAESRDTTMGGAIRNVAVDLWRVLRSRDGVLSALLCFVPVGTGAAAGVLTQATVALHWGAGAHEVEVVQGFLSGLVSMAGCLAGGYGCTRLGARTAYVVYGAIMAAVTAVMAALPATVLVYVSLSLVYAFVTGLSFAAFSAFVLDTIGAGNAATKYNGTWAWCWRRWRYTWDRRACCSPNRVAALSASSFLPPPPLPGSPGGVRRSPRRLSVDPCRPPPGQGGPALAGHRVALQGRRQGPGRVRPYRQRPGRRLPRQASPFDVVGEHRAQGRRPRLLIVRRHHLAAAAIGDFTQHGQVAAHARPAFPQRLQHRQPAALRDGGKRRRPRRGIGSRHVMIHPTLAPPQGLQPRRERPAEMRVHPADEMQLKVDAPGPQHLAHVEQEPLVLARFQDADA